MRRDGDSVMRTAKVGEVEAEVAETMFERMRGLMGRKSLAPGKGMLIRRCNCIHTFFMRFPIDATFLDGQGKVVKVVRNIQPWRLWVWGGWRAKSVLETSAAAGGFPSPSKPSGCHGRLRAWLMRLLKRVLVIAVVVFVAAEVLGTLFINRMMFHPEMINETYSADSPGYVNVGEKGETLAAVVLGPRRGKKAILRLHGNAENMYQTIAALRPLVVEGYTIASVDYPGYGLSSGSPDEAGCYRAAHRLYDWLVRECDFAPEDIVVDGFSIGTGPAIELAATARVGCLVLEAPFVSAPRVVTGVRLLPIDPFPNLGFIRFLGTGGFGCPVLVIHGTEDRVVPFAQGRRIAESVDGSFASRFVAVEGAGHNDIPLVMGIDRYLALIRDFASSAPHLASPLSQDGNWNYAAAYEFAPDHPERWFIGTVCALALGVGAFIFSRIRRRRLAERQRRKTLAAACEKLSDRQVSVRENAAKDVPFNPPKAHTLPLRLQKRFKTLSDLDRG